MINYFLSTNDIDTFRQCLQMKNVIGDLHSSQRENSIYLFGICLYALNTGSKVTVESEGYHGASRNEDACVGIGRCAQCSIKAQRMRSVGHIFMNSRCGSIEFDSFRKLTIIDKYGHNAFAIR